MPELREKEPNNDRAAAQKLPIDHTINGTVSRGDVDIYALELAKNQRIQIEVEGLRLGTREFDPFLELLDATGRVLASSDDGTFSYLDPLLQFRAGKAGVYDLRLRETGYGGGGYDDYRLHVGAYPRPYVAWPPGGRPGEQLQVRWIDGDGRESPGTVSLPKTSGIHRHHPTNDHGSAPTPVRLRVANLPVRNEPFATTKGTAAGPVSWIGPFHAGSAKKPRIGHDTAFAPEKKLDLKATYKGRSGKLAWRRAPLKYAAPLDIRRLVKDSDWSTVYFHRELRAPSQRRVLLCLGSDDTLKVWLNGKLIHNHRKPRGLVKDQDRLLVTLRKGANQLLCKVSNATSSFQFYMRMMDPRRDPRSTHLTLPVALHGRIDKPKQLDQFRFLARKGEAWTFRAFARQLGSELDPLLDIYGATQRFYGSNDDRRGKDSVLRFRAPHTGEFVFRVRDMLGESGPRHVYRVEAERSRRDPFTAQINIAGLRNVWATDVPQNGRNATLLLLRNIPRGRGPLQLELTGLPPGVRAEIPPLVTGTDRVPVVLHASPDAKIGAGQLTRLRASRRIKNQPQPVAVQHSQYVTLIESRNRRPYLATAITSMPVSVLAPSRFTIRLEAPKAPLLRNSPLRLRVQLRRQAKYSQSVRLRLLWNPPGVSSNRVTLRRNQNTATLTLSARSNARIGRYPLVVLATANDGGGPVTTSSQLAWLEVGNPWVTARLPRMRASQGSKLQFRIPLTAKKGDTVKPGECTARLLGMPGSVKVGPAAFAADGRSVQFELQLSDRARPGRHRAVRLRLQRKTATKAVLTADFTGGELRIDRKPRSRQ